MIIDFTSCEAVKHARRIVAYPDITDSPSQRALAWKIEMSQRGNRMAVHRIADQTATHIRAERLADAVDRAQHTGGAA
ncbi:hypothetical protein AQS8620_01322 [Aquimixticola soesokkakensis]|uniref:Uncharacterized protein n=1 Tax=Aquimixticola soesokkakensis TaxID=1519096 RepID=A0A1Y5SG05_9RHOB|nr:hypothetical protein [Aquimixticola soesokkakensis]SLN36832.1 hypothetical protein AQS8620_01322 [Aquimixticola soesokkakensis]